MFKKIFILSFFFILVNCKKEENNCYEKFQNLYLTRASLWFDFEKEEGKTYNNFSTEEYKKLRKQTNDSLAITIDCAMKQNEKNEILYIYKMKQLYLADKLDEISPFLKTIDRKIVKDDIYFQLSLYSLLCQELSTKKQPKEGYKELLILYSPNLNPVYKDRAIKEFLIYLIDNNIEEFKVKLEAKYPDSYPILSEDNRESIIEEIMMRGDYLVFD